MNNLVSNLNVPTLDVGNRAGWTDYIDFIEEEELEHPIVKGFDKFRRQFLVIQVLIEGKRYSQTFFQRYTSGLFSWIGAMGGGRYCLLDTSGYLCEKQIKFLSDLVNNKNPIVTEDLRPINLSIIGKNASIYDKKIIEAVKIIEKNWLICRYDPSYKMCETVLFRNLDIIYNES